MREIFNKFILIRFVMSGGAAAVINVGTFYVLTDIFNLWYLVSSPVAFAASLAVSFLMQKRWTFQDHSRDRVHIQAFHYLLLALFNIALNTFLIFVFVDMLHLWPLLAQIISTTGIATMSFFVYRRYIFVPKIKDHE